MTQIGTAIHPGTTYSMKTDMHCKTPGTAYSHDTDRHCKTPGTTYSMKTTAYTGEKSRSEVILHTQQFYDYQSVSNGTVLILLILQHRSGTSTVTTLRQEHCNKTSHEHCNNMAPGTSIVTTRSHEHMTRHNTQ